MTRDVVPPEQRTFRRYLQTLRDQPGSKLTALSLFSFFLVAIRHDAVATLVMLVVTVPPGLAFAFRRFRKLGTL